MTAETEPPFGHPILESHNVSSNLWTLLTSHLHLGPCPSLHSILQMRQCNEALCDRYVPLGNESNDVATPSKPVLVRCKALHAPRVLCPRYSMRATVTSQVL